MNWESLCEEKRGLEGAMITLYKYLEGHYGEDRDQLLSLVSASRTRGSAVCCWGKPGLWWKSSKGNTPKESQGKVCPGPDWRSRSGVQELMCRLPGHSPAPWGWFCCSHVYLAFIPVQPWTYSLSLYQPSIFEVAPQEPTCSCCSFGSYTSHGEGREKEKTWEEPEQESGAVY